MMMESTHGISAIMQPTAVMVSHSELIMAQGALPFFFKRYKVYDPTVDPFPVGKINTFPAMDFPSKG